MSRKKPWNIGEIVKVTNPLVFVRCGYPLGISDGIEAVKKEHNTALLDLMSKISGHGPRLFSVPDYLHHEPFKGYTKIVKELAFLWLRRKQFGGCQRTIHTRKVESVISRGGLYKIKTIRFVKTGTRYEGGGEDRPYLDVKGTHRIIGLVPVNTSFWVDSLEWFEIEDKHIEKVEAR